MNKRSFSVSVGLVGTFLTGFAAHVLYQRWSGSEAEVAALDASRASESRPHPVKFAPLVTPAETPAKLPVLQARDLDKIRALAGHHARIRGTIFRVGHAAKSNTYFLDFGPSRQALTAVIFASAVEIFEQKNLAPREYAGKNVEIEGLVKDHPQYGLEVILEDPGQIRIVN